MNPHAVHKFSYGIYVLTTINETTPSGCIVNTVFQITSNPARIAVSCNRDNFTHDKIVSSRVFGVTVLSESADSSLIGAFGYKSSRDYNKFENLIWQKGNKTGVPLLPKHGIATFECRVVDQLEVDTHTLFIGEIVESEIIDDLANEMTYRYYHDTRKGVAPRNAPTYIEKDTTMANNEIWVCDLCGYEYDTNKGDGEIPAGTFFDNIPHDWVCPVCGAGKSMFSKK